MADNSNFNSIADAIAAAEAKKRAADKAAADKIAAKRRAAGPWFQGGPAADAKSPAGVPAAKPAAGAKKTTNLSDLKDEFDYAIEAVQSAREAKGNNGVAVEQMATSFLMARCRLSRPEAVDMVKSAIRYIDE